MLCRRGSALTTPSIPISGMCASHTCSMKTECHANSEPRSHVSHLFFFVPGICCGVFLGSVLWRQMWHLPSCIAFFPPKTSSTLMCLALVGRPSIPPFGLLALRASLGQMVKVTICLLTQAKSKSDWAALTDLMAFHRPGGKNLAWVAGTGARVCVVVSHLECSQGPRLLDPSIGAFFIVVHQCCGAR